MNVIFRLDSEKAKNVLRVLEPVVILMIVCQVATLLPDLFPCTQFDCTAKKDNRTSKDLLVRFKVLYCT